MNGKIIIYPYPIYYLVLFCALPFSLVDIRSYLSVHLPYFVVLHLLCSCLDQIIRLLLTFVMFVCGSNNQIALLLERLIKLDHRIWMKSFALPVSVVYQRYQFVLLLEGLIKGPYWRLLRFDCLIFHRYYWSLRSADYGVWMKGQLVGFTDC